MNRNSVMIYLFSVVLFASCKHENNTQEKETTFIATAALVKDTTIQKEYVCQIKSSQHIELRALEKGYLEKIFIDEGQFVKKGQLLFRIMPLVYQAELQKAKAELDYVQIEYENTKSLAEKNIVSKNELALAKAKLEKAKAELKLADVHYQFTEIKAPFDGITDKFHVRLGSLLDESDLITSLSDNRVMWAYFNVPEAEYLNFAMHAEKTVNQPVKLMLANNQLYNKIGKVETIEADFNNETGNIAFRASFDNPTKLLRHSETGNILLPMPMPKAMMIPQKATFEILDKKYVYVIGNDNVVHQKEIKVIADLEDVFIIDKTFNANDKILLEGLKKVHEGEKIQYEFKKPEEVLKSLKVYVE